MSTDTPFTKILVANRGEIALRVMRTARALGYRTVAVYSTADARAAHVLAADEAVCIGEPLPKQSYLRIDALIDAARRTGADAVHPGYGFLAENSAFAAACREAGLVFIGPSAEAITAMGDKAGAKQLMAAAGVPVIPGYQGDDQSAERLGQEAAHIGWPVMIKATAGGGGRGMRLVESASAFAEALRSAQSEAANAFGDATVILERAIQEPRHIEIQVFADRHGHAVHLGERDCSVQRRHQKLIEEAPSPAVGHELRARMGAAAVAAVRAIGYEGAGTLEFLLDREGAYYFMEMNTRLQVEHPVTEAITGLDLVEWQLRVAAGEPLPLAQEDITFDGHAIEVRLCAEDANAGFVPQSGLLRRWAPPAQLRVEHALHDGVEIAPYYDSMIAKLIAHGRTRAEARRKLIAGLRDLVALGVRTNQDFLARCLAHPEFAEGGATTAFIGRHAATGLAADASRDREVAVVAACLLHQASPGARPGALTAAAPALEHPLAHNLPVGMRIAIDGREQVLSCARTGPQRFTVVMDGQAHGVEVVVMHHNHARYVLEGVMRNVAFERDGPRLWLVLDGRQREVEDRTRTAATRRDAKGSDGRVRAAMNGRVVTVMVASGDRVAAGQTLLTLEAMKMEHVHAAPIAGTVLAVHVTAGEQVGAQRIVVEVQADAPLAVHPA